MGCVAYDVLYERIYRLSRIREVFGHFHPRVAAVEVRLAVLVRGVERGVVQRGLWFKLGCPLVEQLFRRRVGVVALGYVVSPLLPPKFSNVSAEEVVKPNPLGVGYGVSP